MTNAEKETIVRWDCESRVPVMYTADPLRTKEGDAEDGWPEDGHAEQGHG